MSGEGWQWAQVIAERSEMTGQEVVVASRVGRVGAKGRSAEHVGSPLSGLSVFVASFCIQRFDPGNGHGSPRTATLSQAGATRG